MDQYPALPQQDLYTDLTAALKEGKKPLIWLEDHIPPTSLEDQDYLITVHDKAYAGNTSLDLMVDRHHTGLTLGNHIRSTPYHNLSDKQVERFAQRDLSLLDLSSPTPTTRFFLGVPGNTYPIEAQANPVNGKMEPVDTAYIPTTVNTLKDVYGERNVQKILDAYEEDVRRHTTSGHPRNR